MEVVSGEISMMIMGSIVIVGARSGLQFPAFTSKERDMIMILRLYQFDSLLLEKVYHTAVWNS